MGFLKTIYTRIKTVQKEVPTRIILTRLIEYEFHFVQKLFLEQ
uniref:Uncharacterized protein n=1 Tax=Rhizophora mucronata TaxID=61149 RepID=A0A2P2QGM2_RHIMU